MTPDEQRSTCDGIMRGLRMSASASDRGSGLGYLLVNAADMLESQFIAAERDAEAIRQLREDNARLTACLANYHEAESDRIATAEQQEADEERDRARHRCGADIFSTPESPS